MFRYGSLRPSSVLLGYPGLRQPFEDAGGAATSPRVGSAAPSGALTVLARSHASLTALCVACARLMSDALSAIFFVESEWFRP